MILIVLALLVSGCAAGRAYRKGQEAARVGDWDAAVTQFTKAVQESPENAEYKISLERAMQSARARAHQPRPRARAARISSTRRSLEYRKAAGARCDEPPRSGEGRGARTDDPGSHRERRPKPPIEELREQARRAGHAAAQSRRQREPLSINFNNAEPARHAELHSAS